MSKKIAELTQDELNTFNSLKNAARHQSADTKLSIVQRLDLDISEPDVLDFLMPSTPEIKTQSANAPNKESDDDSDLSALKNNAQKNKNNINGVAGASLPTPNYTSTSTRSMTYANSTDWIIIQNRLLHAISHLTLNERRLILFLSPIVRKETALNDKQNTFTVRAIDFAKEFGIKKENSYKTLEQTADSILEKAFWFWNFEQNDPSKRTHKTGMSWVAACNYIKTKGEVRIELHNRVIEMLTIFDKNTGNFWTQYHKDWVANLGTYGIIMLEMILSSMESKGYYTIEHLRQKFACTDIYPKFSNFKIWVLDKAVNEIQASTPIRITYQAHKTGRHVTGITFSYVDTSKNPPIPHQITQKNTDPFVNFKMTQKQMSLFAGKIKKAFGQPIDEIIMELSNVHLQSKHVGFLKVLDYVPSDWYTEEEIRSHLTAEQIKEAKMLKKTEIDKIQEDQKNQLEEDYEKILQNAEVFVMANQHRIRRNTVEQFLFEAGDYLAIIKSWKNDLMDEKSRKNFNKIDEIL